MEVAKEAVMKEGEEEKVDRLQQEHFHLNLYLEDVLEKIQE